MKDIANVIVEVTSDVLNNIAYFIRNNLVNIANITNLIVPYLMFYLGQDVALKEGDFSMSPVVIVPLFMFAFIFYLKSIANKIGKGITVPVPEKRFTEVDDEGEVSVENNRLQEMLLYMADLEDWLDKKGLFK